MFLSVVVAGGFTFTFSYCLLRYLLFIASEFDVSDGVLCLKNLRSLLFFDDVGYAHICIYICAAFFVFLTGVIFCFGNPSIRMLTNPYLLFYLVFLILSDRRKYQIRQSKGVNTEITTACWPYI